MRYLPLTDNDRKEMLEIIGKQSVDELFDCVPKKDRAEFKNLPNHMSELAVEQYITKLSDKNMHAGNTKMFAGCGAYLHHIPATVDHIIQRSEFLTSYTPYQPEIAQGTLQYLFEFQSQITRLTGLELANASLYDGSTACAEAALMSMRITRKNKIVICEGLHPHYEEVTKTYLSLKSKSEIENIDLNSDLSDDFFKDCAGLIIQTPDIFGRINDYSEIIKQAKEHNVLIVYVCTEIVSLGILTRPSEIGADIFVAEGQSLGSALSYGGPYLGLFATKKKYLRQMPGRVCGQTKDKDGNIGYVLTMSTREQHIRRDKATSNICTNSGLCALAFTIHLALLGGHGLSRLAKVNHNHAIHAYEKFKKIKNITIEQNSFFNEFTIDLPCSALELVDDLCKENIIAGVPAIRLFNGQEEYKNKLICSFTEYNSVDDIDELVSVIDNYINK